MRNIKQRYWISMACIEICGIWFLVITREISMCAVPIQNLFLDKSKQINRKWSKKFDFCEINLDCAPKYCCHANVLHIQVVYQLKILLSNGITSYDFFEVFFLILDLFLWTNMILRATIYSFWSVVLNISDVFCLVCFVNIYRNDNIEALRLKWNCISDVDGYNESSIDFYEFDPFDWQDFPFSEKAFNAFQTFH